MTQVPDAPNTPVAPVTPPVTPPAPNGGNGEPEKKFSQAEVEAMIKDRIDRRDNSERKKLLEKLGIDDEDADAELLKAAKAKREADKTEVERLAGETAKETKRADELQAQLDTMKAERLLEKRDGALKDALTALNIKKDRAQAALSLLRVEQAAALAAAVDAEGNVSEKALTKLAEDAKKAYPEWFGGAGVGSPSNAGGRASTGKANVKIQTSGRL
jgi:multidrug efflux pump subunit AcrA (membrane-fusion protein)